jgi:hypothetical protein
MSPNEKLYLALVLFAFGAFTGTVFALATLDNLARRRAAQRPPNVTSMPRGASAHHS